MTTRIFVADIQRIVARRYHCRRRDLLAEDRTDDIVRVRHIAMFLAKKLTPQTWRMIGRCFERDRSTIWHATHKIEKMVERDAKLAQEVQSLAEQVQNEPTRLELVFRRSPDDLGQKNADAQLDRAEIAAAGHAPDDAQINGAGGGTNSNDLGHSGTDAQTDRAEIAAAGHEARDAQRNAAGGGTLLREELHDGQHHNAQAT